jgi:hypothetical protein
MQESKLGEGIIIIIIGFEDFLCFTHHTQPTLKPYLVYHQN